jgi:hypothetical protein
MHVDAVDVFNISEASEASGEQSPRRRLPTGIRAECC